MTSPRLRGAALLALVLALVPVPGASAATVVDLGADFVPDGVSNKDVVVGDYAPEDVNNPVAAVWKDGVLSHLTAPIGSTQSTALAVNESGRISGDAHVGNSDVAVFWDSPTGAATQVGTFSDAPYAYSQAVDVDQSGRMVGRSPTGDGYSGFLSNTSGGGLIKVGDGLRGTQGGTSADAITPDGATILGEVAGTKDQVNDGYYLFSSASPGTSSVKLSGTPPASGFGILTGAYDASNLQNDLASDGAVLVRQGDNQTGTTYVRSSTGALTAVTGLVAKNAINAKHVVVGTVIGDYMGNQVPHAAMWKDGALTDLNDKLPAGSPYVLEDALAINDNGDIAGIGARISDGAQIGFLYKQGFVVDTTGDKVDKDLTDGACLTTDNLCTLRAAIQQTNHDAKASPTGISFTIAGQTFPTISPATPLPAITAPVEIDGTTQANPVVQGTRKIGVVIDGTGAGTGTHGFDLAAGAAGSTVAGVQIQKFTGDGVKLGAADSQVADSVLFHNTTGVEIAASGDTVGTGHGLAGNIVFDSGDLPGLSAYLKGLGGKAESVEGFESGISNYGAAILLKAASANTKIMGNEIGVHGPGFSSAPDTLPSDGFSSPDLTQAGSLTPFGILIAPTTETVSGITIGGAGVDANVISGTGFGVMTIAGGGAAINGLSLQSNIIGAQRSGSALNPFGTIVGLFGAGNLNGLVVGGAGTGNRIQGAILGAVLAGEHVASPVVKGNTFGVEGPISTNEIGLHDGFGLIAADVHGAQIGGHADGEGNQFVGDAVGMMLAGDHLSDLTASNNTIGSADPTKFTTFAKIDPKAFNGGFGVVAIGNATAGVAKASQNVVLDDNDVEGNVFAMFSGAGSGLTLRDNRFDNNALGVFDVASGGTRIGTAGHGNEFGDNGLALFAANIDPDPAQLDKARVNPADTSDGTREEFLNPDNGSFGINAVDAITTAGIKPTSADTPSTPGTNVSIQANTFGVDADGDAHPNELPILLAGDEHGLRFGGLGEGEGNVVRGNRATGLVIVGNSTHQPSVQVLGNTIYDNENFTSTSITGVAGLGIDLVGGQAGFGFGVNPQDQTQPDQGPNGYQNAPILTGAVTAAGKVTVTGTLHGIPNTAYTLEVFSDERPNPFGAGEGQNLLGRPTVTTDGAGNAAIASVFTAPPASARYVSATATTAPAGGGVGVTSEFAVDVPITTPAAPTPTPTGSASPSPSPGPGTTAITVSGSTTVRTTRSTFTLPAIITCASAASSSCTVTTEARVPAASAHRSVALIAKRKRKPRPVTVGKGRTTIAAGASARPKLTLTKRGFKLLKRHKTLKLTVVVKVAGRGRKTVSRTLKVKVKYKKR